MIGKIQSNIGFKRIYLEKPNKSGKSRTAEYFKELEGICKEHEDTCKEHKINTDKRCNLLVDCLNEGLQALDKATEITGKDYYLIYKNHDIDSDGYKYPLHTMSVVDSDNRLIAYTIKSWTDFKSSRCCWIDNLRQCFLDTASFLTKKLSDSACNSVDSIIDRYSK